MRRDMRTESLERFLARRGEPLLRTATLLSGGREASEGQKVAESHANVTEHLVVAERSRTVVSVSFLDIGKPQTITAPQHAVPVHGQG